jgi:hypothetical protein
LPSVYPFEQHCKSASLNLDWRVLTIYEPDIRKVKRANLQSLGKNRPAVTIPPKHFDEVTAFASEEKQCARKGILSNQRLNQSKQTVKAASHIHRFSAYEYFH